MKNEDEKNTKHDGTQLNGQDKGPYGSDGTDADSRLQDNKNQEELENSANGMDSVQVRGGQDGRNIRAIGSTDMDSQNGILRMGDTSNSTMEVTEEAEKSIAADSGTKTATVNVTTHGPDDYASDEDVETPEAQKEAKEQDDLAQNSDLTDSTDKEHDDIARTGTSTEHKPTY